MKRQGPMEETRNDSHIKEFCAAHRGVMGIYAIVCSKTWRVGKGSSKENTDSMIKNQRGCNVLAINDAKIIRLLYTNKYCNVMELKSLYSIGANTIYRLLRNETYRIT